MQYYGTINYESLKRNYAATMGIKEKGFEVGSSVLFLPLKERARLLVELSFKYSTEIQQGYTFYVIPLHCSCQ